MPRVTCPVCYGGKTTMRSCNVCGGTGRVVTHSVKDDVKGFDDTIINKCSRCNGTGNIRGRCTSCMGYGYVTKSA